MFSKQFIQEKKQIKAGKTEGEDGKSLFVNLIYFCRDLKPRENINESLLRTGIRKNKILISFLQSTKNWT